MADTIAALLSGRRGHFVMESGYHSGRWFDLDALFDRLDRLHPFIAELARRLSSHDVALVCGPMTGGAKLAELIARELRVAHLVADRFETPNATGLFPMTYRIADAERQSVSGRSVAIVDDAISAGSAVRGTYADLIACGARPVALGALIVFGGAAPAFAAQTGLPLESIERMPLDIWLPVECPLCEAGTVVERVPAPG
jgi:orotate phosphoribosyltransferase